MSSRMNKHRNRPSSGKQVMSTNLRKIARQTGIDVFRWWMEDDNISGQLSMDDLMEDNNV